jgi:hypothetical protein
LDGSFNFHEFREKSRDGGDGMVSKTSSREGRITALALLSPGHEPVAGIDAKNDDG